MTYNVTMIAGMCASNMTGCFQVVNSDLMNGLFGTLILVSIGFILAMVFYSRTYDLPKSIAGSLAVCLIASIPLWAIGLIPTWLEFIVIVGCAASLAFVSRQF